VRRLAHPFEDVDGMFVSCVQMSHDTSCEVALMHIDCLRRIPLLPTSKTLQSIRQSVWRVTICNTKAWIGLALSRISLVAGLIMIGATLVNLPALQTSNPTTLGLRQYVEAIATGGEPFELPSATKRVYTGIIHHEPRFISPGENWLQAILGLFYAPIKSTQDTNRLLSGGIANCSERAQILKTIAESAGCQCRFVGLEGHVVLEVKAGDRWQVADPDYGVVFEYDMGVVVMPEQQSLITAALTTAGHPPHAIDRYLRILQSTDDNRRLPIGSPISPRLYQIEQACKYLIWIIPALALSYGGLSLVAKTSIAAVAPSEKEQLENVRKPSPPSRPDLDTGGKQATSVNQHKSIDSRGQACICQ
jgi:hypothetical protein